MSTHDPAALFGHIDRPVAPNAVFAEALLDRLLGELERPRGRLGLPARTLLLAAALGLLLAGVATATYLIIHPSAAAPPKPGALTVISGSGPGGAAIAEVLPSGGLAVVWHCPGVAFCGDLTSVDWAPDGRRVAFTLDEIGGRSAYVGLHILDTRTGRDLHIPEVRLAHPLAPQPNSVFAALAAQSLRRLGCYLPSQVAWSPDGHRLAYTCTIRPNSGARSAIFTIRTDGTGRRRILTGVFSVSSPSWSPDGKRIAFRSSGGSIYVVGVDGSGRRLVARDGQAPDWSPDGRVIAYESAHGIRLVTPAGTDVTPARLKTAPRGKPAFSPDGSTIAVGTEQGVFLVGADGAHFGVSSGPVTLAGASVFGSVRPAWYPGRTAPRAKATRVGSSACTPCF
jgi:dipeptidyl aminopeptidase/acylaminoacyl peptidase